MPPARGHAGIAIRSGGRRRGGHGPLGEQRRDSDSRNRRCPPGVRMDPIHPLDAPPGHRAGRVWEPHRGHAIGAPILINWVAVGLVGCRSPRTAARNVAEGVAVAPSLAMAEMLARPGMRAGTRLLAWLALPQLARISRPPGPDCAVTVQRVPGSRECGGLFAAISYPVLYAKSAGIQARGGNGVGVCSFDRFLPQGVTTRPLGEARTRNVFAATAGIGLWNRGSRADPHDRGDRGVRKSNGRLDSHAQ